MSAAGTTNAPRACTRTSAGAPWPHQLKAASIVAAAAADLVAWRRKREGELSAGERYYFLREHVTLADSAAELIDFAIADRQRGIASSKRITRAIYADEALLRAALGRARKAAA
jgi:hypothetical protein